MATPTLLCVMLWWPTSHALPGVRSCRGSPHSSQVVPFDTSPQPCGRQGPGNGQDQQHMDVFGGETTDGVDVSLSPHHTCLSLRSPLWLCCAEVWSSSPPSHCP